MKKNCVLIMAVMMVLVSVMTGCQNNVPAATTSTAAIEQSATATAPAVAIPDKITIWAAGDGGGIKDWNVNPILMAVEQATNTDITLVWNDSSAHSDKLNAAAASNDFPDMACAVDHMAKTMLQTWVDGKVIAPLEGEVAAAAPNWVAEYANNSSLVEIKFNDKIYLQPVGWGTGNAPNMGLVHVRGDLMEKYSIKSIDTWDQYKAYLKAAVADGLIGVTSDGISENDLNGILGGKGLPFRGWVKTGVGFEYWAVQPGVGDAIVTLRELFTEGLMDPGVWEQKKARDLYVAGKAASYIFNGGGHIGRIQNDMALVNPAYKEVMLPALDFGTGKRGYSQEPMFWGGTVLGAQAKNNPVAAARVVDFLISDKGNELTAIGIEGKDFQREGTVIKWLDARFADGFPTEASDAGAHPLASAIVSWQPIAWQNFTLLYGKDQAYQDWYAAMNKNQEKYQITTYGISATSPKWTAFQATAAELLNRALTDAILAKNDAEAKTIWDKFVADWKAQGGTDASTEMSTMLAGLYK